MSARRALGWGLALFLLAASAVMQLRSGAAGDKDWLLLAAKLWLGGRKIGTDIFEVNPPLILWLYALPVRLSQWLPGLPDYEALALLGLGATALCSWLGARLIAYHPAFAGSGRMQADFGLLLAIVFLFFSTQLYFFDRDHVMLVLVFPYMLRFMPSLARQKLPLWLRLAVALLAAVGFCIKPYDLVIFAILQLLYIARERSCAILWSVESCVIYVGGALYLLCVGLFAPDYVTKVMPMAFETYSGFSRRINGYLFGSVALVSLGLTFVDFRPRHKTPFRRDVYYFLGAAAAFFFYALMNNGWGYTYHPLLCTLLFISAWMLWDYGWLKRNAEAQGISPRKAASANYGCIANLGANAAYMVAGLAAFFFTASCDSYAECKRNDFFASYIKEHRIHSFSTMSMDLRRWTSLVRYTGAQWDTRFNSLWMLPTLLKDGEPLPVRHRWIADYMGQAYAEDLARWKPEIVFVDTSDGIFNYPHPVDIPAFLSRVPAFKEAWHGYRYDSTLDSCAKPDEPETKQTGARSEPLAIDCRFAVYRRVSAP